MPRDMASAALTNASVMPVTRMATPRTSSAVVMDSMAAYTFMLVRYPN